jgi:phospholipase A-2-activating protein
MELDEPLPDFQLRAELRGHEDDVGASRARRRAHIVAARPADRCRRPPPRRPQVRCLAATASGLATGSRDKTIKLWDEVEGDAAAFECAATLAGHADFVSALAWAPPGAWPGFPGGALLSGGRDARVLVWDPAAPAAPLQRLEGHKYQVAALAAGPAGAALSASLDGTLRLWRGGACERVLEGHQGAVLACAILPGGATAVSGGGDRTVRAWNLADGKCTFERLAHEDSVRALASLPGVGLVTGSHDASLKVWTLEGEQLAELVGHTSLVYSVAAAPAGGEVSSGGEDGTARVWRPDGACLQTLPHPGCVWAVCYLPCGDLVTACEDGVARVWTRAAERLAPPEARAALAAALEARAAAAAEAAAAAAAGGPALPPGLKLADPAALQAPGSKDGQTLIVAENGGAVAYSWDGAAVKWERVGEVVAPPGGGGDGRKEHAGRSWDYVFDVDVADGAPPLKLAMDADENPYAVADRFIEQEGLPEAYKEQIVVFVLQNTGGGGSGSGGGGGGGGGGQYVDPFTGASAYVPPAPGAARPAAAPAPPAGAGGATGGGADPFTGEAAGARRHLPARGPLLYDAPPAAEGVRRKLAEFSAAVGAELAAPEGALAPGGALDRLLERAAARRALTPDDLDLLCRLLSWPAECLFPALDLARLALLEPAGAAALAAAAGELDGSAPAGSLGAALAAACAATPPAPAALQTALRAAANCFAQPPAAAWALARGAALVDAFLAAGAAAGPKGVRQGLATLLHNLAAAGSRAVGEDLALERALVAAATALLEGGAPAGGEDEAALRALVALGTAALGRPRVGAAARTAGALAAVVALRGAGGRVGEAAAEADQVLRL